MQDMVEGGGIHGVSAAWTQQWLEQGWSMFDVEFLSLQRDLAAKSICFGCGPVNENGLRIQSWAPVARAKAFADLDQSARRELLFKTSVRAVFRPESHHQAFPGVVNGGILGAILDCHSNWTAAWALMCDGVEPSDGGAGVAGPAQGSALGPWAAPCTVTADFHVHLLRPTPLGDLEVSARAVEILPPARERVGGSVRVEATVVDLACGKVTAKCEGLFVAVKQGHPAFHRW